MSKIVVVAKLNQESSSVRLAVDTDSGFSSPTYSSIVSTTERCARLEMTGLASSTNYFYAVEIDGTLDLGKTGKFTTIPAAGAASFRCCFSGDSKTGSNHAIFDTIRAQNPLFFIHMGDMHYQNIATNDTSLFDAAYNASFDASRQHQLYREVPTVYMFDDHDYGGNNSDGTSPSHDAAIEVYRRRVPHHTLVESGATDAVYHSFEVGRVVFIVTDLRSEASPDSATDNSSKTMMGTTQKNWFKSILSDPGNASKLFVWVHTRTYGTSAGVGKDSGGGFTTERTEIANYIKVHCPGRIILIAADMHAMGIDDGTNMDFATGGGNDMPVFQAAPLDRGGVSATSGAVYSEYYSGTPNGTADAPTFRAFGIMDITDTGGATITVDWTGKNSSGTTVATHQIIISV